ncbi:hypothetical protein [Bradyrhizobium prioriisuperbiae]|uniref:hypothetical protein n=1 Tax=Bradyrhizobium prioriisuperbiae TaxID=2854389 RepID=UPI0028F158DE|nr:hypothetical protein [Bradyrhizobium prioritasuperba]
MALRNPYLEFYRALPQTFRRDPQLPISTAELTSPEWLMLKAAIAGHFAWAVPTEDAIQAIREYTSSIVEIGAGSGYWTWMMRQAGLTVAAYDTIVPSFTWDEVEQGDERAVLSHPDHTLFLCWPPWASDMACNALAAHHGDYLIYVGEWMGGSANPGFFMQLASSFEPVRAVDIPQWYNRDDRLMIFRRRRPGP